jgi:flagellar L-ring protein precursor FlgH
MKKASFIFILGLSCLFLTGCAGTLHTGQPQPQPTSFRTIPTPEPMPAAEGSLFNPNQETSFYSDFRARHIGDVVTIVIQENLKGSKNVNTQTARDSDMNLGLTGIMGLEFTKRVGPRYPDATLDPTNAVGGSTTDSFKGSGKTSADASLTGTISARVVQLLPGRNLLIEGSRELRINNETQYLIISGVIRPQDLGPDNTVPSTRIADARIEYTGGGVLSEKQNPAWFARMLGAMAPF